MWFWMRKSNIWKISKDRGNSIANLFIGDAVTTDKMVDRALTVTLEAPIMNTIVDQPPTRTKICVIVWMDVPMKCGTNTGCHTGDMSLYAMIVLLKKSNIWAVAIFLARSLTSANCLCFVTHWHVWEWLHKVFLMVWPVTCSLSQAVPSPASCSS